MTRINVVPVHQLEDSHLRAEFRELTRIPNTIVSGKAKVDLSKITASYVLGKGHVTFFYDKLEWLRHRYDALFVECLSRGFNVTQIWPNDPIPAHLMNDYVPTPEAIKLNQERILDRMPKNARYKKKPMLLCRSGL